MRRPWLLLGLLAALPVGLAFLPTYVVRTDVNDAPLLWNDREALVFVVTSRVGWRLTYGTLVSATVRHCPRRACRPR